MSMWVALRSAWSQFVISLLSCRKSFVLSNSTNWASRGTTYGLSGVALPNPSHFGAKHRRINASGYCRVIVVYVSILVSAFDQDKVASLSHSSHLAGKLRPLFPSFLAAKLLVISNSTKEHYIVGEIWRSHVFLSILTDHQGSVASCRLIPARLARNIGALLKIDVPGCMVWGLALAFNQHNRRFVISCFSCSIFQKSFLRGKLARHPPCRHSDMNHIRITRLSAPAGCVPARYRFFPLRGYSFEISFFIRACSDNLLISLHFFSGNFYSSSPHFTRGRDSI